MEKYTNFSSIEQIILYQKGPWFRPAAAIFHSFVADAFSTSSSRYWRIQLLVMAWSRTSYQWAVLTNVLYFEYAWILLWRKGDESLRLLCGVPLKNSLTVSSSLKIPMLFAKSSFIQRHPRPHCWFTEISSFTLSASKCK